MGIGLAGTLAVLAQAADQPNVVIIYGDDVGYGDVGAYGSEMIPTPNIDRLAAQGLRFTDGHCSAATCTPSRFSMLTGIHGFRHNARVLPPNAPLIVPTDKLTLPKLFKKSGYQTAVIGKWHLGIGEKGKPVDWNGDVKPGPLEVGFDYSFLLPSTNDRVPCVLMRNHRVIGQDPKDPLYVGNKLKEVQKLGSTQYPDGKTHREAMTFYPSTHDHDNSIINGVGRIGYQSGGKSALWDDATLSDVFVEEMERYIADHKETPFFLYFASQDIHVPRVPHPRFRGKTKLGYRGDAMVQFDWSVGEIMKALDKHGLAENTIVIFSSDNGPVYDDGYADGTTVLCSQEEGEKGHDGSGVWRGGKYQIYEGGTRVPFIVRWPARVLPGTSDALVSQIDLLASFAELLDVSLGDGDGSDSRSSLAAFLGDDPDGQEYMIEESFGLALRKGEWKYIEPSLPKWPPGRPAIERSLYNLSTDPSETTNVIADYPEVAGELEQQLKKWVEAKGIRSLK
ncbi:Arylsulfatase [Pontiella desulfatans]|uniref:Arylsulfatase n=2 Tax=Pontiella desulfatans TaxID=2750659 RepID=A0A6C2TWB8_PONDE|nr:sulfatase S1_15 [Kiritimatiellales bacterium]VGO11960.1 Arylsulfatase [Pontiella desulfatans]